MTHKIPCVCVLTCVYVCVYIDIHMVKFRHICILCIGVLIWIDVYRSVDINRDVYN